MKNDPKAFIDFLIVFSKHDVNGCSLRTQQPLRQVDERSGKWKMFVQEPHKHLAMLSQSVKKQQRTLWCFGEIFQYKNKSYEAAQIAEDFLQDVIEEKEQPQSLNGHFITICWDDNKQQFTVWTNRLGTYHAYYSTGSQQAVIGSFFPAVVGGSGAQELDWQGIAGFFGFGFFPEERTYLADVKIFYPASRYIFNARGGIIEQSRYWWWNHSPDKKRSYEDTVSQFGMVLAEVLQDHCRSGTIVLPISGGLDSRTLAAVLPERQRIHAYSYGWGKDSVETNIAGQVAATAQLPFTSLAIKPYLFDKMELIVRSVEGFQDVTICRSAAAFEDFSVLAEYVLPAHMGDLWCSCMGVAGQRISDEALVQYVFKKMRRHSHDWLLDNICQQRIKGNYESFLRTVVKEGVSKYNYIGDKDFRIKAFKADTWSFRWTLASLRMFQAACFPRLPFYDNRIVDFFLTVPSAFLWGRKLQIDYLKKHKPEFARIKWQVYDSDLFHYQYFNTFLLPQRLIRKTQKLIAGQRTIQRNWEAQFLDNPQAKETIEHLLVNERRAIHEFVSPETIKPLIEGLFSQRRPAYCGFAISMLLTFAVWLEMYQQRRPSA